MSREIEYKFLPKFPDFRPSGLTDQIEQGFFFLDEKAEGRLSGQHFSLSAEKDGPEIFSLDLPAPDAEALSDDLALSQGQFGKNWYARPRLIVSDNGTERGVITLKGPGGAKDIVRPEYEYEIDLPTTKRLLGLVGSARILKTRTHMFEDGWHWEVDVLKGAFEPLGIVFCEIELPSETTVFSRPDWLGVDVTSHKAFKNVALAKGKPLPDTYLSWLRGLAPSPIDAESFHHDS